MKSAPVLSGVAALALAGCATAKTNIFPKEDGSNVIIATSTTESYALDGMSAGKNNHGYSSSPGVYFSTTSMDDNKVTMTFKCQ